MISGTAGRSGNGSVELRGDKIRYATGQTALFSGGTALGGTLSTVSALTFDWMIAGDSQSNLGEDYTPALRLHIRTGSGFSMSFKELIWEGAYNNVYGPQTNPNNWYTSGVNDKFYMNGTNPNDGKTIAQWAADATYGGYTVSALSVGQGSSVGAGYHAFADNITLVKGGVSTTYNFEASAAVPEPATWAMMLGGFGLVGAAMRRRQRGVVIA